MDGGVFFKAVWIEPPYVDLPEEHAASSLRNS
jgi:hypothetical protein